MTNLFEIIKPQIDAMNQMYKSGFDEGRRSAFAEMAPLIKKLQDQFEELHPRTPLLKIEELSSQQQGETQPWDSKPLSLKS